MERAVFQISKNIILGTQFLFRGFLLIYILIFSRPVIIEIPHFASLRGMEREVVILRSNDGDNWTEHPIQATDDMIHEALGGSFEGEGSLSCHAWGMRCFLFSLFFFLLLQFSWC